MRYALMHIKDLGLICYKQFLLMMEQYLKRNRFAYCFLMKISMALHYMIFEYQDIKILLIVRAIKMLVQVQVQLQLLCYSLYVQVNQEDTIFQVIKKLKEDEYIQSGIDNNILLLKNVIGNQVKQEMKISDLLKNKQQYFLKVEQRPLFPVFSRAENAQLSMELQSLIYQTGNSNRQKEQKVQPFEICKKKHQNKQQDKAKGLIEIKQVIRAINLIQRSDFQELGFMWQRQIIDKQLYQSLIKLQGTKEKIQKDKNDQIRFINKLVSKIVTNNPPQQIKDFVQSYVTFCSYQTKQSAYCLINLFVNIKQSFYYKKKYIEEKEEQMQVQNIQFQKQMQQRQFQKDQVNVQAQRQKLLNQFEKKFELQTNRQLCLMQMKKLNKQTNIKSVQLDENIEDHQKNPYLNQKMLKESQIESLKLQLNNYRQQNQQLKKQKQRLESEMQIQQRIKQLNSNLNQLKNTIIIYQKEIGKQQQCREERNAKLQELKQQNRFLQIKLRQEKQYREMKIYKQHATFEFYQRINKAIVQKFHQISVSTNKIQLPKPEKKQTNISEKQLI